MANINADQAQAYSSRKKGIFTWDNGELTSMKVKAFIFKLIIKDIKGKCIKEINKAKAYSIISMVMCIKENGIMV